MSMRLSTTAPLASRTVPVAGLARQAGLTLVEAVAALGIFLVVVALGFSAYTIGSNLLGQAEHLVNLNTMQSQVQRTFDQQNTYNDLDNTLVSDAELAPPAMLDDAAPGTIRNNWNGDVTVEDASPTTNETQFQVTSEDVPQDACIQISSQAVENWDILQVNGTEVDGSVGDAEANCVDGANTLLLVSD